MFASTLSAGTVRVRTGDGGLWSAPSLPGRGLAWGHGGSGSAALAALLSRLLNDITGPPAGYEAAPPGLASLLADAPANGATYTRAQLLAARAS